MNTPYAWQTATARPSGAVFDEGLRQHMLRVYNYMGIGLVVTGLVAFFVASTPALYVPIFQTPLKWVVMLAPLAFIFFFSFRMDRMSAASARMAFLAFCGRDGPVAGLRVPGVHRREHRPHLLHHRDHVRRDQPLRLHDQARSLEVRLVPDHGPDRHHHRLAGEHLPRVEPAAVRDLDHRRARVHGPDRLRHAVDQGAVRRGLSATRPTARWPCSARSPST